MVASCGTAAPLLVAVCAGTAAGFAGGVTSGILSGQDLGGVMKSGLIGAGTGLVSGALGGVASTFAPAGALWGSLYGAGTGSVIGGVGSAMTGGDIKEGIIFGAAAGLVGGGIQGYCSAKSQGLNPWTGKTQGPEYNKYILSENGIYSTQKGLNEEKVSMYLEQMKNGTFDKSSRISVLEHNGAYYISDGHCRMTAAYRYYMETGDDSYIYTLKNNSYIFNRSDPSEYGLKNTHLFK